jgi:ubiquinone/menaquinone biosynthesis C-methylase UbiE
MRGLSLKQNKYDEPEFFVNYSKMPRSINGLDEAQEWDAFRALLPDLYNKRLLDLGCGFGWHCRYARQRQARSVVGVDLSEKMLSRARATLDDPGIEYRQCAIEDIDFLANEFDVVVSSLALHYVERFDLVCQKIYRCLAMGGAFVLSVEHPIFTALAAQEWCCGPSGERLHWPLDDYQQEGPRHTQWMAEDVVKYHRTVATYLNTLINSGFRISKISEPEPKPEMLIEQPGLKDDCRRPTFLLIATVKARISASKLP